MKAKVIKLASAVKLRLRMGKAKSGHAWKSAAVVG